jgi:hypothetical protein
MSDGEVAPTPDGAAVTWERRLFEAISLVDQDALCDLDTDDELDPIRELLAEKLALDVAVLSVHLGLPPDDERSDSEIADAILAVRDERDALRAEVERAREELAQADRFGRGEFRVTTWAYDQAVRVMHEAKARASAVADAVRAQHPREVIGEFTWCSGCTLPNARSHVEWPCPTIRSLDAALGPVETPQENHR